jgi:hypothetical protein
LMELSAITAAAVKSGASLPTSTLINAPLLVITQAMIYANAEQLQPETAANW